MGYENSGRRPQPTALKVLRGNPGKEKLNENEPQPPAGEVTKPANLSERGGVVWDRLAPVCIAMGTLTTADLDTFATLCELQADMDMARAAKNAPEFAPFTVSEDYNGAPKIGVHGAIKLEKELSPVIRPYYALFGLEPVSRARIQVGKQAEPPASKWAGVLT